MMCYQYMVVVELQRYISFVQVDRTAELRVQGHLELLHRLLAFLCVGVVLVKLIVQQGKVLL